MVVGWPFRISPICDKAEHLVTGGDLHRAIAEAVDRELNRLRTIFESIAEVKTHYAEGDPSEQMIAVIRAVNPDLVLWGITRGRHREIVTSVHSATVAEKTCPIFVTFGSTLNGQSPLE